MMNTVDVASELFCNLTSPWPSCLSLREAFVTTAFMLVVMMVL
jgi:hypothetical protein